MAGMGAPTPRTWRVKLFGEMRFFRQGSGEAVTVQFKTQKARLLSAYLLLHKERTHPRELLATLFWPEAPPSKARRSLRDALCDMRQAFHDDTENSRLFLSDYHSLGIVPGAVATDIMEWEALRLEARRTTDDATRLSLIEARVNLYVGPLLYGLYDINGAEEWLEPIRRQYAADYATALWRASTLCEVQCDFARAAEFAQRALFSADPDDEEDMATVKRLTALSRRHEREAALRAG